MLIPTTFTTSHFVTVRRAIDYYAAQGYGTAEVFLKLQEKLIHIGAPPKKDPTDKIRIAPDGRYTIHVTA